MTGVGVGASQATRPSGYAEALSRLSVWQKPGDGVPAYLRWVNRGLGKHAAAAAYVVGLGPNAVTAVSGATSTVGLLVLVTLPATPITALAAATLLLAGYALDSADGQLARLTARGSRAGEWLDHVVDALRIPAVHIAIAIALVREVGSFGPSAWLALCFALLAGTWFFAQTLADKLAPAPPPRPARSSAWVSVVKLPYDVGTLYLAVALLAWLPAFLTVYVGLFVCNAAACLASLRRKYLGLRRMELGDDRVHRAL